MSKRTFFGILSLLVIAGCQPATPIVIDQAGRNSVTVELDSGRPPPVGIQFKDVTSLNGVDFRYQNDAAHSDFSILESLGGGVAIFDFDGDDRPDLLFPGGGQFGSASPTGLPSALYRNTGNWAVEECARPARIAPSVHYSHGAITADFDEDGFDDALITGYGGVTLFRNQGDGTFQEVTSDARMDDRLWSCSAAWGDFNGDGYLDLYLAHYVDWSPAKHPHCGEQTGRQRDVCPPKQFLGLPDLLYFSNGDGTFRDGTQEGGIHAVGKGLGVVTADLDLDGDLDLYVANDTVTNLLFRNDGRGHFDDTSLLSGTAGSDRGLPDGSMGTDVGDYNMDGLPDIWVTNYERELSALYRNQGDLLFRHVSQSVGIAAVGGIYVSWGTRFLDADLDGDEDLIVTNGHAIRYPRDCPVLQRPLMLENREGTRFLNVTDRAGAYLAAAHAGRGLATGDLDGDGDEDVVFSNLNEPVAILSNESTPRHNWLCLRIKGRGSCRSAIGAVAVATIGDRAILRQVRGGSSYASTSDSRLHFGLGTATRVQKVTVRWIAGGSTELNDLECNQFLTVIEPPPVTK